MEIVIFSRELDVRRREIYFHFAIQNEAANFTIDDRGGF